MKKFFYGAAAALLLVGAASCDKTGADDQSKIFSAQATDSLVNSFGDFVGATLNMQIAGAIEQDSTITKEAFLKGVQYAFAADTAQAYRYGLNFGMQVLNELQNFERMGVNIDKGMWLNKFKQAFMQDSVPTQETMAQLQAEFQQWNDSLRNAKRAYDLREIELSEEAQSNLKRGKEYIDSLKAADPAVKVTNSGLAYKIENEGAATKIKANDRVQIKATATALNGQNPPAVTPNVIALSALPKPVQEGLQMLGKGGKATLYVPGRQAYELDMAQRMGLSPNSLIIYEVEVIDVPEAPAAAQQGQIIPVR